MKIKQLIVDEKPKDCICCPLAKLKICGEPYSVHMSSGALYMGVKPDKRCRIKSKEGGPDGKRIQP